METDTTPITRPAPQDQTSRNNILMSKLVVQHDYFSGEPLTTTAKPAAVNTMKPATPSPITPVPATTTTTTTPSTTIASNTSNVPHEKLIRRPATTTTSMLNDNYFHLTEQPSIPEATSLESPSPSTTTTTTTSSSSLLKRSIVEDAGGILDSAAHLAAEDDIAATSTTAASGATTSSGVSQQQFLPQIQPNRHRSPYLIAFEILKHFFSGFRHGVAFWASIQLFIRSEKLRTLFWKCFVLNGFIFLGSIAILEYFTVPLVNEQLQSHSHHIQAFLFNLFFKGFYNILWLYPLYSLSFILSNLWYNDIAEETYRITKKTATTQFSYKLFIQMLADLIYRLFVVMFFLVQNAFFGFIPYIGGVLSFLMVAWLYAFYSFEYAWSKDESLLRRCSNFERNWAYFAGFGTPNALMTFFFPFFINNGLWALLFPVFIVQAIVASPPKVRQGMPRIPVFWVSRVLSELVLKFMSWLLNHQPGNARAPTPRRRVNSTAPAGSGSSSVSRTSTTSTRTTTSASFSSSFAKSKHHHTRK